MKMTLMRLLILAVVLTVPSATQAARYYSGGHVVHTRLAPVVVHRIFPPYHLGIHVYAGRPARR